MFHEPLLDVAGSMSVGSASQKGMRAGSSLSSGMSLTMGFCSVVGSQALQFRKLSLMSSIVLDTFIHSKGKPEPPKVCLSAMHIKFFWQIANFKDVLQS